MGGRELKVGDRFEPGTEYRAMIMVEVTDADRYVFTERTAAMVNGAAAVFQNYGDGTGIVSFRFTVPEVPGETAEPAEPAEPGEPESRPNPFDDVFPEDD